MCIQADSVHWGCFSESPVEADGFLHSCYLTKIAGFSTLASCVPPRSSVHVLYTIYGPHGIINVLLWQFPYSQFSFTVKDVSERKDEGRPDQTRKVRWENDSPSEVLEAARLWTSPQQTSLVGWY